MWDDITYVYRENIYDFINECVYRTIYEIKDQIYDLVVLLIVKTDAMSREITPNASDN